MGLFAPVTDYIAALVHPSARRDAPTAARHFAFIAPRLLGSIVALASFPLYLLVRGAPSAIELMAFAWLFTPLLLTSFLSRTARYESAYVLSSLALTTLVTGVAAWTGGISSFAAIWLVVVPLEAALSASRLVVTIASIVALAAAGLLAMVGELGLLPLANPDGYAAVAALAIVSAVLFAAGLVRGAEVLARTSFRLLHAGEERCQILARNVTEVITRHGSDGELKFVSPAACSLFGCGAGELHGRGLFDRVHVADRPAYLTALGDAAAIGERRSVEFRVRRNCAASGGLPAEFIWIEMRCQPLEQAEIGETRHEVVAVLREITERKRQERALEDARAEVERANAAKSRFLATMSHELRTPLNVVIGFSEMLMKESSLMLDVGHRAEYAGLINDSGRHLLAVVNGVLDISKIETGSFEIVPEPFDPARVIAACFDLLKVRADEAGVALVNAATGRLPEVIADKRSLRQILLNLISNAIQFTDRGGKVTISARAEAGSVAFIIEDDGIGIDDADLAHVGEPYFQVRTSYDRRHSGTGLGLSIVKGLTRLHGGDVTIQSRVGRGTRVSVRLPLDCEPVSPVRRLAASAKGGASRHLTVQQLRNAERAAYPSLPKAATLQVKKSA